MQTRALQDTQASILAADIRANTDPVVVAALAIRDDDTICAYYNAATTTKCWISEVDGQSLFELTPITVFDSLTAGKREAWMMLIEQSRISPLDFGRSKFRSAVVDIWAASERTSILNGVTRYATRAEILFGGTVESTGGVSATDLKVEITLQSIDVSLALNQF